jgi:hypothetical protein
MKGKWKYVLGVIAGAAIGGTIGYINLCSGST